VKGAIDKSIKDQPIATLAVAAAAGFVLGGSHKPAVVGARECLCSRTDRDAVVACLVPGPQMRATPRLSQGLRESKFHGHWVPSEGQASVNQQTIAASDLPRCPRKL
jgi:hypothetical protein